MKHEEGEEMCYTQCMTVSLIRSHIRSCREFMFVTDLIKDMLTISDTAQKAIAPEMDCNHDFNIFGNWKNATMQQR